MSSNVAASPKLVKRIGQESVAIVWTDGHESLYPNQYLRENCPCAACREGKPRRALPIVGNAAVHPVQIGVVGRYALSIQWSDRHDDGIYSYATLRELCPCAECSARHRPSVNAEDEPTS